MTVIPTGADEFVLVSADEEVVVNRAGGRLEGERHPAVKQEGDEDESVVKEHDSQADSTGSEEEQDDAEDEDEDDEEEGDDDDDDDEGDEEDEDIEGDDQEEEDDEEEEEADCCASKSTPLYDWAWFDILLVTFFTLVLLLCLGSLVGEGMRSMAGRDGLGQQQEMERARLLWEVEEVKSMLMQQEMQQKHLQADMEQIRNTQRALHSQLMFLRQQQAGRVGQHYNLQQHDQQEYILKELEELRQRTGATEEAVEHVMEVVIEQQRHDGLFEVLEGFDHKLMSLSSRLGWLMDELEVPEPPVEVEGEYGTEEWHAHHHHHCC